MEIKVASPGNVAMLSVAQMYLTEPPQRPRVHGCPEKNHLSAPDEGYPQAILSA
jgi:hypothetical protein